VHIYNIKLVVGGNLVAASIKNGLTQMEVKGAAAPHSVVMNGREGGISVLFLQVPLVPKSESVLNVVAIAFCHPMLNL